MRRGTDQLKRCWFVLSRKASTAWDTTRLQPSGGIRRSRAHMCQLPPDLPPEAWKAVLLRLLQGRRWTPGWWGGSCPPQEELLPGSAWLPTVLPRDEAGPSSQRPPLSKPSPGVFCSFFQPPPVRGTLPSSMLCPPPHGPCSLPTFQPSHPGPTMSPTMSESRSCGPSLHIHPLFKLPWELPLLLITQTFHTHAEPLPDCSQPIKCRKVMKRLGKSS